MEFKINKMEKGAEQSYSLSATASTTPRPTEAPASAARRTSGQRRSDGRAGMP